MKTILTPEQSQRLIELGVPENISTVIFIKGRGNMNEQRSTVFNLVDLLSILPKKITDRSKIYEVKIWVDHYSDAWCIEYINSSAVCDDLEDSFHSGEELADAIYEIIVWLKENPNLVWL